MTRYRDQVTSALAAVTIRDDTRYVWLGRLSRPLPAGLRAAMDAGERRRFLVGSLGAELYASFYRHGRPVPARRGDPEAVAADPVLVGAMAAANRGGDGWEPGWTVVRVDDGAVSVTTGRLRARVAPGDCRSPDGALAPGTAVSLRVPTERAVLAPGFYTVIGATMTTQAPAASEIRVYWNVGRAGAPELMRTITSRLNAASVPFRLKIADHAARLERCDAAVLYLDGDAFTAQREALGTVAAALRGRLRPGIPAFTLAFAPGVGVAENHPSGDSFGTSRCTLLAEAIVRAHERGVDRVSEAVACFAERGIDLEAPYREPALSGRHVL